MQIPNDKIDDATLKAIGRDVVRLLCAGEVDALADRYGYAVELGRGTATGIRDDLAECLGQVGAISLVSNLEFDCEVKFFAPNSSNLLAIVECVVPALNGGDILIEIAVTSDGSNRHATLEQISAVN
ncbi:hypothetical protein [Duganella sp. BuS-21]|uniref:hypothetical protein n=1 Tax=Duganella sp. BuS-21 TaxID=2943848 RepID=UPI0035A70047